MSEQPSTRQLNRWANRALENVQGGWYALAEHQVRLIAEATGGIDVSEVASYCNDCGTRHDPADKAACIEGHGEP